MTVKLRSFRQWPIAKHAHLRSTSSSGKVFRINVEGSEAKHSFHKDGTDCSLYVFEAPIDLLSHITLYPAGWLEHSYVACCGTSVQPVLERLRQNPKLNTAVRGILSNEKYAGDVLMQKTFQQDCISHKTIRNTGQRPMYLVQNNHEAIIDRKTYDAVQTELARRNALKGNTQKSTPSGRSCYTPKYALSDRVICGECGTLYRRCTWVNRGKKHIVWRCISRFDYGKKYCHDSPAVDEQQLQQAILRVINGAMSEKPALVRQVTENLQVVIRPSRSEELTIADIDHQLETLAQEFDATFATAASGNSADYSEHFKTILTQQAELKAKRAELERQQAEDAELTSRIELAADTLEQTDTAITEWDEYQIRALVESVRILSKEEILVRLKSGIEKIERLQK